MSVSVVVIGAGDCDTGYARAVHHPDRVAVAGVAEPRDAQRACLAPSTGIAVGNEVAAWRQLATAAGSPTRSSSVRRIACTPWRRGVRHARLAHLQPLRVHAVDVQGLGYRRLLLINFPWLLRLGRGTLLTRQVQGDSAQDAH
jgi:hypothetical protein